MACLCSSVSSLVLGPGVPQDGSDDEDEEWPTLEKAATMTGVGHHAEVVVDPEDERAIEMFMNKNPPARWGWHGLGCGMSGPCGSFLQGSIWPGNFGSMRLGRA